MRTLFVALFCLAIAAATTAAETGELVLRAVDIDTGEPVAGVSFAVENGYAEDWAVEVGTAGTDGMLKLDVKHRPGYYYMVWKKPKQYKVVGYDDAYIKIKPGDSVGYDFKLRKQPKQEEYPAIVKLEPDHQRRVPAPRPLERNVHLASTVEDMPGFEGKTVTFWFYPTKQGDVAPELLDHAERIFANGSRVGAAVRDELEYFQKAVPADEGDIDGMQDILITMGPLREDAPQRIHWRFWCRLPGGIEMKQHGYRVDFTNLAAWDLHVPFYLQPAP